MDNHKKRLRRYTSWACIAALVALLAALPLMAGQTEIADGPKASILSGTVERRDISPQLIGGGQLASEAQIALEIPAQVKLTAYMVGNGDTVSAGDPIARVDRVSVMTAITQVQETLEYLSGKIADTSGETNADTVSAQAGGTVKIIYAQEGEQVCDVMLEHGTLAVLSLDGLMTVEIGCDTGLTIGEGVSVSLEDGTEVPGIVESNVQGLLKVTVEDDGYPIGAEATVSTQEGEYLGNGLLAVHSPWSAMGYSGAVSDILVQEGDTVRAGQTLLRLEDTGTSSEFQGWIDQRQEYEALMEELFQMYDTGTVTAPCDGIVTGVDVSGSYMLSAQEQSWQASYLSTMDANWTVVLLSTEFECAGDPEVTDCQAETHIPGCPKYVKRYASVQAGWVRAVDPETGALTVLMSSVEQQNVTMEEWNLDTSRMTWPVTLELPITVVDKNGSPVDGAAIREGDILVYVSDEEAEQWVLAGNAPVPEGGDTPSQEGGQSAPSGGGMVPSGGTTQQTFEPYSLDTVTVASVTSQEHMTVEITVDELDISGVYVGQTATVTVDALTGEKFPGEVTAIGSTGTSGGGNSKFTVEVTLEKSGNMLPGMNATAFLDVGTQSGCLSVPVAALQEAGTDTVLYTGYDMEKGTFGGAVSVTVGASDGEYAQILAGAEEGTAFYYAYYDTLEVTTIPAQGTLWKGNRGLG